MYELIQHQEVGAGGASSITFSDIPQIYNDLIVCYSLRHTATAVDPGAFYFNTDTGANYSMKLLLGDGSGTGSFSNSGYLAQYNNWSSLFLVPSSATANTFSSTRVYIPNYTNTTHYKSVSIDTVNENNATGSFQAISAGVWNNNNAINAITISSSTGLLAQYGSATLYGVGRRQGIGRAPLAIGGYAAYDNGYWYHSFPSSGSFKPFVDMDVEYLVIAGGGGTTFGLGGGGGAGGYRSSVTGELSGENSPAESKISLTAFSTYPVVVGAGGAGEKVSNQNYGGQGSDSSFAGITSLGGGRGVGQSINYPNNPPGQPGGSGSGGVRNNNNPGAGTSNQGHAGGYGSSVGDGFGGGGGGGAGGVGSNGSSTAAGNGGSGIISSITGYPIARAGGGGGTANAGLPGLATAGGGNGGSDLPVSLPADGEANTGGGGGGGRDFNGRAGGSGIVIVRYRA